MYPDEEVQAAILLAFVESLMRERTEVLLSGELMMRRESIGWIYMYSC